MKVTMDKRPKENWDCQKNTIRFRSVDGDVYLNGRDLQSYHLSLAIDLRKKGRVEDAEMVEALAEMTRVSVVNFEKGETKWP